MNEGWCFSSPRPEKRYTSLDFESLRFRLQTLPAGPSRPPALIPLPVVEHFREDGCQLGLGGGGELELRHRRTVLTEVHDQSLAGAELNDISQTVGPQTAHGAEGILVRALGRCPDPGRPDIQRKVFAQMDFAASHRTDFAMELGVLPYGPEHTVALGVRHHLPVPFPDRGLGRVVDLAVVYGALAELSAPHAAPVREIGREKRIRAVTVRNL